MNRAKIIIAGVAILAAIIIGLIASSMLEPEPQPVATATTPAAEAPQIPQSEILVATRELKAGTILVEADMAWMNMPETLVSPSMIQKKNDPQAIRQNIGKISSQSVAVGEPLRQERLNATVAGGTLSTLLKPGMRAYTIAIDEKLSTSGFLLPRDIVDVIAFSKWDNVSKGAQLVLKGAKVLAIGTRTDPAGAIDLRARHATLEVTPFEMELLAKLERANIPLMVVPIPLEEGKTSQDERSTTPVIVYQKRPL